MSTRDPFTKDIGHTSLNSTPSIIPGAPPLQDLVVPSRSTVGAKLLRSMGWKEGQGVGPKVARETIGNVYLLL